MVGAIAFCSIGRLGLITADTKRKVTYPDKTEGWAWVGIHLTNGPNHHIGDPWSARNPRIVGHVDDFIPEVTDPFHDEGNATNHRLSQCGERCQLDHLPEGSH